MIATSRLTFASPAARRILAAGEAFAASNPPPRVRIAGCPEWLPVPPHPMTRLLREVAAEFRLTVADLSGPSKLRHHVRPRQVAMLLARELTAASFPEIGRRLGGRDHTTVLRGIAQAAKLIAADPAMAAAAQAVRERVAPAIPARENRG